MQIWIQYQHIAEVFENLKKVNLQHLVKSRTQVFLSTQRKQNKQKRKREGEREREISGLSQILKVRDALELKDV